MIAWYGEQKLKDAAMERLHEHRRLDELVQGVYFENGKGCHLGCLTHDDENSHEMTERMFGIDQRVAYWLESVFEHLPTEDAARWVIESTESIPVGADLSKCHHHFSIWLLQPKSPIGASNSQSVRYEIAAVRALHEQALVGDDVTAEQWIAESAAESAAWSAVGTFRSSAKSAAWKKIAAKSIEIFSSAPVRAATEDEQCDSCVEDAMAVLRHDAISSEVKP